MSHVTTPKAPVRRQAGPSPYVPLTGLLDDWLAEGIITPEQAERIHARAEATGRTGVVLPESAGRSSLAVEALGYLGGVIVVVATMLIAAQYWSDITVGWRLVIVGAAAAAMLAGGLAVPARLEDVGVRLRSVLWLASTGAVAGFLGLLGSEVFDLTESDLALMTMAGTAVLAMTLWGAHRVLVQQMVMMVALMATAAAAIADSVQTDTLPGLGVWGVGAVWLLLGWGGILGPRPVVVVLGAGATIVGAIGMMSYDAGIVLAMATAAAIVSAAVLFRDLVLLAVGALGALVVLPPAVNRWFPDSLAAPIALLVVGALLVGAALWIARRRVRRGGTVSLTHDYSVGQPAVALRAAAGVIVAVVATVLTIALV